MAQSFQPVQISGGDASVEKGENARMTFFVGAIAISDLVKSTLGPKGMDKILVGTGRNSEIQVTNDGATILKAIPLDNPAAKVLVDISKVQDDEVGDGTTSVCVLAGELLREGEKLMNLKLHPNTIIQGWRMAVAVARKALEESAIDNKNDVEKFRKDLLNIASTTLSSKILAQDKTHFAELAVSAVLRLKGDSNLQNIQVIKKLGGSLQDSYLDDGFILDKKIGVGQPKRMENCKILIANTAMDSDKIKIFSSKVRVDSPEQVAKIEQAEREKMLTKCKKIIAHGINIFVNRQLIYNLPEQFFADHGIIAIEHADFDGIERLAKVTGGEIVSTFEHPELVKLGTCKLLEEIMIGEDKMLRFSGVAAGEACTIVLRGSTHHVLNEAERSLHDALSVLATVVKESRTVYGGGCSETIMAKAVDELAANTSGKKQMAIKSFAAALRSIPTILSDNAGYDSAELVSQLISKHNQNNKTAGLNLYSGCIGDMAELGVTESYKVKLQVLVSAAEAAEMIMRCDAVMRSTPRPRERA